MGRIRETRIITAAESVAPTCEEAFVRLLDTVEAAELTVFTAELTALPTEDKRPIPASLCAYRAGTKEEGTSPFCFRTSNFSGRPV
jgi:hypothetical protein